jgi:hypothetical protein
MIKFGMGNTLLTFVNKYYKYGGDLDVEDRGLTIGGYELAWLTDLCLAYIMDNSRDILDELVYEGIYRDNGIAVFKGPVTTSEVAKWLGIFQARVNNLADSKFLEFTTEVWRNNRDDGREVQSSWNNKQGLFSISRYGNVLVSRRQSTLQSTPKREPSTEISQLWKYAHQCMFCFHSYRSHEKTSISYNKNSEIRVNDDGQTLPSAR